MEDSILKILLASGVIANLVTSIFNLTQGFHKDKIDNVIKERKSWREKIRSIAAKIQGSCKCDIKNILSELKVRLNAYGMKSKSDYEKDGHIWGIIRKMEDTDYNQKEYSGDFEVHKKLLVEYLSLLLKYDWERSKNEVFGNIKIYAFDVVFWIGFVILLFTYSWFYNNQLNSVEEYKGWHIFGLFIILYYLVYKFFELITSKSFKICLDIKKNVFLKSILVVLIAMIVFIIYLGNIWILIKLLISEQIFINVLIVYIIVISIFGFIKIVEKNKQIENEEFYKSSVEYFTDDLVTLKFIIGDLKKFKKKNGSDNVKFALNCLEKLKKRL